MPTFLGRLPLVPLFTGTSLVVGLLVPSIYEFSQKPYSRTRYYDLEKLATFVVLVTIFTMIITVAVTRWLDKYGSPKQLEKPARRKLQFKLSEIFIAMTATAVTLATIPLMSPYVASCTVLGLIVAILGWSWKYDWQTRSRTAILLASMFLPFVWVIRFSVPIGHSSGLIWVAPLGPGIVWAEMLRAMMGVQRDIASQIAILFVIVLLYLGVWLVRRGGKSAIICSTIILVTSTLSSLALHALYRA